MSENKTSQEKLKEASFLIRNGGSAEAIPILDVIVDADPDNTWALEERGRAKMFTCDYDGAIADFSTMIARWPANHKGFTCRADARKRAGDLPGAIDDYSSAIELDPRHPFAYLQRGRLKVDIGDYPAAIADFTTDMEVDCEGRLSGLLNRGKARHVIGDLQGAIDDLTEALALEGDDPVFAPLYRGQAKMSAGDYLGAVADFTVAIGTFPQLTNAYRLRAEAKQLVDDKQGAEEDLAQYNQLGGKDLPAYS